MDTRFVLPVSIAVAVHAVALFFPKSHYSPPIYERPVSPTYMPISAPMPPEPLPPEETQENTAAKGGDNEARRSPDPVTTPNPSDFIQSLQPPSPEVDKVVTTIPKGPPGVPGVISDGGPGGPSVIGVGDLDKTPRATVQVPPVYPTEAKVGGRTAEVLVEFVVDEQGRVNNARVVRSSDPLFDEASLQAVRKWRFEPGRKDGRIVSFRLRLPMTYNLNE